jgi:hypothetical protein
MKWMKVMRTAEPNVPAQAGRGKSAPLQTETRSRPCLQPDGSALSLLFLRGQLFSDEPDSPKLNPTERHKAKARECVASVVVGNPSFSNNLMLPISHFDPARRDGHNLGEAEKQYCHQKGKERHRSQDSV